MMGLFHLIDMVRGIWRQLCLHLWVLLGFGLLIETWLPLILWRKSMTHWYKSEGGAVRYLLVLLILFISLSLNASALDVTRSTILYSINDTYAQQGNPDANRGTLNYMNYGYYSTWLDYEYAYIKFPTAISGSNGVVNATVYMYQYGNELPGDLYRVIADWGEYTLTWNNK